MEDLEDGSHFVLGFLKDRGGGVNWKNCFGELSHGIVIAGNFGLEGQETTRIPKAREPERLFLVG
jgi:hypothetical protein